jgi:hypothetical protein
MQSRTVTILTAAAVSALALSGLTGCGGSSKAPTVTAAEVVAKLKAAGLPISDVTEVTAADDPNHLLGRPGGYTTKEYFSDSRLKPEDVKDDSPGSVDLGGNVEVYSSASGAKKRAAYIKGIKDAMQFLGTEYDYVSGSVLLRLSQSLTPEQAAAYKAALG